MDQYIAKKILMLKFGRTKITYVQFLVKNRACLWEQIGGSKGPFQDDHKKTLTCNSPQKIPMSEGHALAASLLSIPWVSFHECSTWYSVSASA